MKCFFKLLALSFVMLIISGCASAPKNVVSEYELKSKLNGGYFELINIEFHSFQNNDLCSPCSVLQINNVQHILREKDIFRDVTQNSPHLPYTIRMNFNRIKNDNDLVTLTKIFLTAFTLGVIPYKYNNTYQLSVDVRVQANSLKTYEYTLSNRDLVFFLLDTPNQIDIQSLEILLSRFLEDLTEDKLLPVLNRDGGVEGENNIQI